MPRNTHPLYGLVTAPAHNSNGRFLRLRPQRELCGNPQAEMLAEWLREMHFPRGTESFRRVRKGRVKVRITFLKPIATGD